MDPGRFAAVLTQVHERPLRGRRRDFPPSSACVWCRVPYSADQPPSEARMAPLMLVPSSLSRNVMDAASCAAVAGVGTVAAFAGRGVRPRAGTPKLKLRSVSGPTQYATWKYSLMTIDNDAANLSAPMDSPGKTTRPKSAQVCPHHWRHHCRCVPAAATELPLDRQAARCRSGHGLAVCRHDQWIPAAPRCRDTFRSYQLAVPWPPRPGRGHDARVRESGHRDGSGTPRSAW